MSAYEQLTDDNQKKVRRLLDDTAANQGLAPLDLERFWADQAQAGSNPFGTDTTQPAFGASCTRECIFAELGMEEDFQRLYTDPAWAQQLSRQYNDRAEKIVGRRILPETMPDPGKQWPEVKALHDIFEGQNIWEGGKAGSWWLKQAASTPDELAALLDRVDARLDNLRAFLLPPNWDAEKKRLMANGHNLPRYRAQRGPCTFACSIYGAENLLLLHYDDPALFARFSDTIARAIIARAMLLDSEAGDTPATAFKGWWWADDNCCLFTPEMYETFAMPIHRQVFATYAPEPGHYRYQHSDSSMAHLLPLLSELDLTGTNFGPTLTVAEIRASCPHAVIEGQLAPFTYSRNEEANMVAEFLRDFDQAREKRGLNFTTAGSINNGTRLTSMRLLMAAIQRYGRYDSTRA